MRSKYFKGLAGLALGGMAFFAYQSFAVNTSVTAADMMTVSAEEAHETREGAMKAIGGHLKALGAVAKGEMAPDAGTVVHAESLAAMSHTVKLLFAQELISDKSRAKPEIWSDWAGFSKAADDLSMATAAVVEAAKGGDPAAIGAALGDVGKACGGCHKPYRGPEK
ncbi:MAG: cytochrome C556 [Rhodospirillaceae bacterium]|jgi:cytochrome c556|uniref:c-type cytochrome n=1 Tax=unclassified Hwanghaeella TaxID=2605944 RepID=UPI000C41E9F8|nr:cytochrome C556 [Rhodospirillales bacterium]MAX48931.1 cytochrome C556 [Rhodospirillaceae bacterium]|tara:strand:- start:992 stop:1489 length:498 start_codon:yes stop_codon:yes gene_type:complete